MSIAFRSFAVNKNVAGQSSFRHALRLGPGELAVRFVDLCANVTFAALEFINGGIFERFRDHAATFADELCAIAAGSCGLDLNRDADSIDDQVLEFDAGRAVKVAAVECREAGFGRELRRTDIYPRLSRQRRRAVARPVKNMRVVIGDAVDHHPVERG